MGWVSIDDPTAPADASGTEKKGKWKPLGGPADPAGAEIHNPVPGVVRGLEDYVLQPAMMGGGAAVGALAGAASPVPGGALMGGMAGGAVGSTEGDLLTAQINHSLYGTPINLDAQGNLPGFRHPGGALQESAATGALAEPVSKAVINPALGWATARSTAEAAGTAAAEGAETTATEKGAAAFEKTDEANKMRLAQKKLQTRDIAATQEQKNTAEQEALEKKAEGDLLERQAKASEAAREVQSKVEGAQESAQAGAMAKREPAVAGEIQQQLGATPEDVAGRQAKIAGGNATPEAVAAQDAYFQGVGTAHRALNDRYHDLLKDYANERIEPTFGPSVEEIRNDLIKTGRLQSMSAKGRKLLDEGAAMAGGAETWGAFYENLEPEEKAEIDATLRAGGRVKFNRDKPSTISLDKLMSFQSRLTGQLMTGTATATDKSVARDLLEGIDNTIVDSNVMPPEARKQLGMLKKLTREHYDLFSKTDANSIGGAKTVEAVGDTLFGPNQPESVPLTLIQHLKDSPEQVGLLRQSLADKAASYQGDLSKLAQFLGSKKATLKALYGDTALSKVEPWLNYDRKATAWGDFLKNDPGAAASYQQIFDKSYGDISHKAAVSARDSAVRMAKQLGPTGEELARNILAAGSPENGAALADQQLAKLYPKDFVAGLKASQLTPGQAIKAALPKMESITRRAMMEVLGQNVTPSEARRIAMAALPTGDEAAIKAIANMKADSGTTGTWARLRVALWATRALHGFATGNPLNFGTVGLAVESPLAIRMIGKKVLSNPTTAESFWNAVKNGATRNGLQSFGQNMSRAAASEALSQMKPGLEKPLPQPGPPPPNPLPKLGVSWKQAPDDKARLALRDETTKAIKGGAWAKLSPQERQQLSPILAEMYRRKDKPERGAMA